MSREEINIKRSTEFVVRLCIINFKESVLLHATQSQLQVPKKK